MRQASPEEVSPSLRSAGGRYCTGQRATAPAAATMAKLKFNAGQTAQSAEALPTRDISFKNIKVWLSFDERIDNTEASS